MMVAKYDKNPFRTTIVCTKFYIELRIDNQAYK